jgi:hypothetical protein
MEALPRSAADATGELDSLLDSHTFGRDVGV